MIRKYLIVLVAFLLVGTITGTSCCTVESDSKRIEDTIVSFYNAYNEGDLNECLTYYSQRLRGLEGDSYFLDHWASERETTGGITIQSMSKPLIEGARATVQVSQISEKLGLLPTTLHLINENGNWKLDW